MSSSRSNRIIEFITLAYFFIALYRNSSSTDKFLAKSSPTSLKPLVVQVGDDIYSVFGQLKNGVKQGV